MISTFISNLVSLIWTICSGLLGIVWGLILACFRMILAVCVITLFLRTVKGARAVICSEDEEV